LSKNTFSLTGYVKVNDLKELKIRLEEKFKVFIKEEETPLDESYPIVLKNSAFSAPLEPIVKDYSLPSVNDIDPTSAISFFYYFFFGMMFSDAGYGLLMVIGCGLFGFVIKNVKPSFKLFMRMFFYCGISTIFWGLLYGGFFGNIISIASNGSIELSPILFDPTKKAKELLVICISIGMFHIFTGLFIKFYILWRQGKKWDAIFDVGFWIMVLMGICALCVGFGFSFPIVSNISVYIILTGVAGLILTGGRENKNIFVRLFMGIISLYDITGYLSDALSYSRLMALGLATGVIANVVNIMGSLGGGGIGGIILFIIVFIIGHTINFAVNMLGAYVHTNRLQYVEFFGKFYEGGGRDFKPFSIKTSFVNIDNQ
jgi:V/A-type H+-transporting ATPase subunit I